MEFSIRSAQEADAQGILAVLNPLIEAGIYSALDQPYSLEQQRAFMRDFPVRGIFHVAVSSDGQVIGLQSVEPFAPWVRAFGHVGDISTFVGSACQSCGVGRHLFQATRRAAREKGYRKIMAMVRADNPQAIGFYKSQGFSQIGIAREHALIGSTYIDEVLLECFVEEE